MTAPYVPDPADPAVPHPTFSTQPPPSALQHDASEAEGVARGRVSGGLHRGAEPTPALHADDFDFPAPRRRTRRRVEPPIALAPRAHYTPRQRLLLLDTWLRSKLPAQDFGALVGLSIHTLYLWKRRFEELGPAGLEDQRRGPQKGSRLSLETQRAILLMKQSHPEWGEDRIHDMLARTQGLGASPGAIGHYLQQEGYVVEQIPTRPHPERVQHFERSRPNELWQTDLFTFVLKRQNRRVHMVAFMDDHSRFIVGYGIHASSSGALVREVLEAAIANFGAPLEVLTDNGTQYHTWRGKSAFTALLERRGIKQIVARPRHPQTLGKVERFWGTLWRECVERAVFLDLDDARRRIGHFIDHYNFQRTHSGIDGLVPADRFFAAAPQVLATLRQRVEANARQLAQHGMPRKSFYLIGRVGDANISLHAEGERVVLTKTDGTREEVDLAAPGRRADEPEVTQELPPPIAVQGVLRDHEGTQDDEELSAPGSSPLDNALRDLAEQLRDSGDDDVDALDAEVQP